MKKIFAMAAMLAAVFTAKAQENVQDAAAAAAAALANAPKEEAPAPKPNYWTRSAEFTLGFNQTSLSNWAAGGYNTLTLATGMDLQANYAKELMSWNNRMQLNYGFLWSADKKGLLQKSNDRIYLESKWGYDLSKTSKWKYTASFDFRTQFTDSRDSYKQVDGEWTGTLKSSLMSPAYTNLALGMEWKPADWFNVNIAPLTGGFTICTVESLRKSYGMKPVNADNLDLGYRSFLFQFGAQVKANAKWNINDKFGYETQLVLFTDYLNKPFIYNRVNWDNKIRWTMTKFFSIGLDTWLIYDPIVTINDVTSRVQFKEFFSVNFIWKITNKK